MTLSSAATLTGNALSTINMLVVDEGLSVLAGVLILIVGWLIAT